MKDRTVKKTIEIEVPAYWEEHPDVNYDEIRKKIYSRWAVVEYLTGKKAEEWLWENDSHLYNNGAIAFLDATKAIEEAVETILVRLNKKKMKNKKKSHLIQHTTDYKYDCTCGGKPKYIGSEWQWKCFSCGAKNY